MDQHELVSALKELAIELGRTPSRDEFVALPRVSRKTIDLHFGTYSALIQASGIDPVVESRKKLKNEEVFGRDIEEVLSAHQPKGRADTERVNEPILIIGDAHFPFVHKPTLEKIITFAQTHQPKHIVQIGDLYDLYSHSKFPRSLNIYTPDQELDLGRGEAEAMWKRLLDACPDAKCYQIMGNHDVRPMKRVIEAAPALESIIRRGLKPYFEFTGVQTIDDYREILSIQGIGFHHGYLSQLGGHRDFNQRNMVVGHTHKGGTVFRALADRTIWELNVGFIGDETSKVMGYTPTKTTGWTLGNGWIDQYGPRFIPL